MLYVYIQTYTNISTYVYIHIKFIRFNHPLKWLFEIVNLTFDVILSVVFWLNLGKYVYYQYRFTNVNINHKNIWYIFVKTYKININLRIIVQTAGIMENSYFKLFCPWTRIKLFLFIFHILLFKKYHNKELIVEKLFCFLMTIIITKSFFPQSVLHDTWLPVFLGQYCLGIFILCISIIDNIVYRRHKYEYNCNDEEWEWEWRRVTVERILGKIERIIQLKCQREVGRR